MYLATQDVVLGYVTTKAEHTNLIILRKCLVMLSPQLRPFRKLVLRACTVHLPFQLDDLPPFFGLIPHTFRR